MATPMFEQGLTLEDVLELSADELRDELAGRDIDPKGMSKVEMQKALVKILFPVVPVAPVVAQTVSPLTALSAQQLMELEVMKLKMESEEKDKSLRFELEALERKEQKEAESLAKKEAFEKEEKAIERQEKAEALRKQEIQEAEALRKQEKQEAFEREEKAEALRKQEKQEAIERQEKAEALERRHRIKDEERQRKEKREAIEEDRKAALLERKLDAEETANKFKLDLEDRKIRENRAIEESKLKMQLDKLEMDDKEKARQHEINLKRLDQNLPVVTDPIPNDSFRLSGAIKFVPPFDDVDMTQFLNAFEKAMAIHNFPKDKWTQLIHTKLTGKAQKVFAELGVEACLDYDTLKAALLLAYERIPEFTNCLPTEIYRWVVEKRPKLLVDAAKLADEYAVLYRPFHAEQDNSWRSDDRNFSDKTDKTFHKNGGRGTFHQKYHHKGNNNHKTAVPVTKNWAQEVLCIRCGRGGHTALVCYAKKPFVHPQTQMQNTAFDAAPKSISLVTKHQNLQLCRENQGLVHKNLAPFCVNATLCTNKGSRRPVVLLRDSGALQSLVSKKCLAAGDYVDTLEYRLIQGILGQPTEVPLVEVRIESDKLSGKILCGLVDNLPHGIDFLIGNDLQE